MKATAALPVTIPEWAANDPLGLRWWQHRLAHPEVERLLVGFAREWRRARPGEQCSIKMCWERLRWETSVGDLSRRGFRLNNTHTALWSRWLMENYPDLAEPPIFVTRVRPSQGTPHSISPRPPNGAESAAHTTSQRVEPLELPTLWRVLGPNGRTRHLIRRSVGNDPEAEGLCGLMGEPRRSPASVPRCHTCLYRIGQLAREEP